MQSPSEVSLSQVFQELDRLSDLLKVHKATWDFFVDSFWEVSPMSSNLPYTYHISRIHHQEVVPKVPQILMILVCRPGIDQPSFVKGCCSVLFAIPKATFGIHYRNTYRNMST